MPPEARRFSVTVSRTEEITFELDAVDLNDALDRYLADGDEVTSRTTDLTVLHSGAITDDT